MSLQLDVQRDEFSDLLIIHVKTNEPETPLFSASIPLLSSHERCADAVSLLLQTRDKRQQLIRQFIHQVCEGEIAELVVMTIPTDTGSEHPYLSIYHANDKICFGVYGVLGKWQITLPGSARDIAPQFSVFIDMLEPWLPDKDKHRH